MVNMWPTLSVMKKNPPPGADAPLVDERATISKLEGYLANHRRDLTDNVDDDGDAAEEGYDKRHDDDGDDDDDEEEADHAEIYEELEVEMEMVTLQLVQTQSQLRQAHSNLKEWDDKVSKLERQLQAKDQELKDKEDEKDILLGQVQRLQCEVDDRDNSRARPELEQRLRKAVEFLKKDLAKSQEKHAKSQSEVRSQKSELEKMEQRNTQLEEAITKLESTNKLNEEKLVTCHLQLDEAREQATTVIEEMATIRDELTRAQNDTNEKQARLERDITKRVKERIRLQVRNETTQEITERTNRQVRAEMKAEKEKELDALREQFKKVFKEHAILKKKVDDSEYAISQSRKLEQQVPFMKDEISRLLSIIDSIKETHEEKIAELETCYRNQIKSVQEAATKEKWDHANEIRKQISKERDREVQDFTQRIEALSMQTDRLLQRAEKEKEEYADQVRKRVTQDKQREIQVLMDKLAERTRDSDELLEEAARDKEMYGNHVRQQMMEEKNREVNKFSYRIEVLTSEKETLLNRIQAFEEELSWTWKEQDKNVAKMKTSQMTLKSAEEEVFKLRRKNQNLTTMVERYKNDLENLSKEFNASKAHFRESMLESEDINFKLKDETRMLEAMLEKVQNEHSETLQDLDMARASLLETAKSNQNEIDLSLAAQANVRDSSNVHAMMTTAEAENVILKERISELENFETSNQEIRNCIEAEMEKVKGQREQREIDGQYWDEPHTLSTAAFLNSLQIEISRQRKTILDQKALLEHYQKSIQKSDTENMQLRSDLESSIAELESNQFKYDELMENFAETEAGNSRLNQHVEELNISLDACKRELVKVSKDLEKTKELEASIQSYENELFLLREHLNAVNSRLEQFECGSSFGENDIRSSNDVYCDDDATVASEETAKLKDEIRNLESMIEEQKMEKIDDDFDSDDSAAQSQHESHTNSDDEVARLKYEIENLTAEIERKETEMSDHSTASRLKDEIVQLNLKIEELHSVLDETATEKTRAFGRLAEAQIEKSFLREKLSELENDLGACRNDLSRTSEELERSREEVASQTDDIRQLQQRVERLNLMVETTERNRNRDTRELETSKERYADILLAHEKETECLHAETEKLSDLLKRSQEELQETKEQALRSRTYLEDELVKATEGSLKLDKTTEVLQSEIQKHKADQSNLKKETLHSKRLFHEALMESEKTIFELNEKMQALSQAMNISEKEFLDATQKLEADNKELHATLVATKERYSERVEDLEALLATSQVEQERVAIDLQNLESAFREASQAFEMEKSQLEIEIRKLRDEVVAGSDENLEVAKELQHSRLLFKEALIGWRAETTDLREQLRLWRTSENMEVDSSRDSFSVQSQQQSLHPSSQGSRGEGYNESRFEDYRGKIHETDVTTARMPSHSPTMKDSPQESPGRLQPSHYFSRLLDVDTDEGGPMSPYAHESSGHQSHESITTFFSEKKKSVSWMENEWDNDASAHTDSSKSTPRTFRGDDSSSNGKAVRWKDTEYVDGGRIFEEEPFDETKKMHTKLPAAAPSMSLEGGTFETRYTIDVMSNGSANRGRQTILSTGRRSMHLHDIEGRDDEVTVDSHVEDSSSTGGENDSLQGSSLLHRRHLTGVPRTRLASTIQQGHDGQTEESRDDRTVQSRDSFSYSTASNHSTSRYFNVYAGGGSSSSGRDSDRVGRSGGGSIERQAWSLGRRVVSNFIGDAGHRDDEDGEAAATGRLLQGGEKGWDGPVDRFSEREPVGMNSWPQQGGARRGRGNTTTAQTERGGAGRLVPATKPAPYDEGKELLEEEQPFDVGRNGSDVIDVIDTIGDDDGSMALSLGNASSATGSISALQSGTMSAPGVDRHIQ